MLYLQHKGLAKYRDIFKCSLVILDLRKVSCENKVQLLCSIFFSYLILTFPNFLLLVRADN